MDDEDLDNVLAGFSRASNSSSSASPLEVSDVAAPANQSREHAVEASANTQQVATREDTTRDPGWEYQHVRYSRGDEPTGSSQETAAPDRNGVCGRAAACETDRNGVYPPESCFL